MHLKSEGEARPTEIRWAHAKEKRVRHLVRQTSDVHVRAKRGRHFVISFLFCVKHFVSLSFVWAQWIWNFGLASLASPSRGSIGLTQKRHFVSLLCEPNGSEISASLRSHVDIRCLSHQMSVSSLFCVSPMDLKCRPRFALTWTWDVCLTRCLCRFSCVWAHGCQMSVGQIWGGFD